MGGGQSQEADLAKAASCLAEMASLLQEDLQGVEVVEGEARKVRQWRLEVERQAEGQLTRGMATGNQTHLATGLQVFYNLGTLASVLDTTVADMQQRLRTQWTECLDIKRITEAEAGAGAGPRQVTGPGKAALPVSGNNAAFRSSLWANIDLALEAVHGHMSQLWLLQRLLTKKLDPVTHQPFITTLQSPNIVLNSWVKICKILKDCLFDAQAKSNFVKQTFEGEYPKLVKLYEELWNKLKYTSNQYILSSVHLEIETSTDTIDQVIFKDEMEDGLRESLSQFENAYLARSLSRLFDPINLMFGGSAGAGQLSAEEVDTVVTVISSELAIASVDPRLVAAVTRNIAKAVALFCVKCEGCVDSEASQVIGQPSPAQLQNIRIVNTMAAFSEKLAALCSSQAALLGQDRVATLQGAAQEVAQLMGAAVAPLLDSVNDSIEAILLTMHNEDFSASDGDTNSPAQACSLYMKELQAFLERISRDFFATFTCKEFLFVHLHAMAEKTIHRFVMQGSLVRPLGSGGAMRLASDCAQLEFALSTILGPSGKNIFVKIICLYSDSVVLCRPVRHRPHRPDCAGRQLPAAARLPLAPLPQPGGHGELPRAGRHRAALHRAAAAHLALPRGPRLALGQPRLVAVSLHGLAGEPSPGAGPAHADEGRPGGLRGLGPGQAGQKLCAAVSSSHRYIRKGISCFLILDMCVKLLQL